jgi:hypothetical protein
VGSYYPRHLLRRRSSKQKIKKFFPPEISLNENSPRQREPIHCKVTELVYCHH